MKRYLPILILAFLASGCNMLIKLPVGGPAIVPAETFSVNEAVPAGAAITDLVITMAPSNGSLELSGGTDGLVTGAIQYNIAEWEPVVTLDGSALHIEQKTQENQISSAPDEAFNDWDLGLGNMLVNISISCPTGDNILTFASTLQDGTTIYVNGGVGNLRLVFPAGVTANVKIDRGPSSIATEGRWEKDGKVYISGDSGPVWTVNVDFGVGSLTLANQ